MGTNSESTAAELPSIPKGHIDKLVTDPTNAKAVQAALMAVKKAQI